MSDQLPPDDGGNAHRFIAGRARELDVFRAAFTRMLAGRRQLVLISGEAGIGKTRCAEALADVAEDQGALVLWGRCREEAGAPPYWPWVQVLRAYLDASSLDEVRLSMGAAVNDIATLVPELVEASQRTQPPLSTVIDANAARFRIFDAVAQLIRKATQQVPITVVLDNLHWADTPSLSLLEFVTQEVPRSRLMLVGTYRNADTSQRTPLLTTLGGLSGELDIRRVHLAGLSQAALAEVAEHVCGLSLSESAVGAIYQRTDGNPLFAIELMKVLIDESDGAEIAVAPTTIPAGVRETIGRRLIRLSERCNELLCVAALFGRQFAIQEVAAAADAGVQTVLNGLEPAVQAGIVQSIADLPGCCQFTHALIRETIYESVVPAERLRLHQRAAAALVCVHSAHPERALTRIAHHYYEAAAAGNSDTAVVYALRAADSAVRMYAYEDALVHYERAIEVLERLGLTHDERLARAYILKGSALMRLARVPQSIEVLLEAVNRTRALGNAELLVDVLMLLAMASSHVTQQHFVPLLGRVLALFPDADSIPRAKALATLAFAQRTSTDTSQLQHLVDDSLAMANRCRDSEARCACYQLTIMALRGSPESLTRRLLLGEEFLSVARATGNLDQLAEAYHWQTLNYFEAGQLDDLEVLLEHYRSLSASRSGHHQYLTAAHSVTLALLRGDWVDLERRIEVLQEIGTRTRRDDAGGVYGAQMFALNRDFGRLHTLAPQIKEVATSMTGRLWEPGLMLLYAEIGLLAEAGDMLNRLLKRDCRAMRRDDMYVTDLVFCAETCCALADTGSAELIYQLLRPYEGQTVNHPTAVCFGASDLFLAMLACTASWPERARVHFERALTLNRSMRAWPSVARTSFHYGRFLLHQQMQAERPQGLQQLRDAEQLARRLGMSRLVMDIDALLHSADEEVTFPDDLTAREVEVLRLLAIGRTNKDVSQVLAISLNTVATHVHSILSKTQCANRTEAARYAIRHGLQVATPGSAESSLVRR